MSPKVSILIPTYNRAHMVGKAIESALAQDYPHLEVIVSDNASEDGTEEAVTPFLSHPKFRYFRNSQNLGMVANWRKMVLEYARGEWFLILSDDDYFVDSSYIRRAMELADRHPELVLIYANGYVEDSRGLHPFQLPFQGVVEGKEVFMARSRRLPVYFTLCNILFHRPTALQVGVFPNPYNLSCDSELFLKMCLLGKVGVITEPVSVYCQHGSNLITTIGRSPHYLLGNLDFLLEPFVAARDSSLFTAEELATWFRYPLVSYIFSVTRRLLKFGLHPEIILNPILSGKLGLRLSQVLSYLPQKRRLRVEMTRLRQYARKLLS